MAKNTQKEEYLTTDIDATLEKLTPSWFRDALDEFKEFQSGVTMVRRGRINHYLLNHHIRMVLSFETFNELYDHYVFGHTAKRMSRKTFMKVFDHYACAEWRKHNRRGESFGGPWKHSDPSVKSNAPTYCKNENRHALWRLPYSHELIIRVMQLGCCNHDDNVPFVVAICELIQLNHIAHASYHNSLNNCIEKCEWCTNRKTIHNITHNMSEHYEEYDQNILDPV